MDLVKKRERNYAMSFWSVCQTETNRELTAVHFLDQQRFETYLPKIRTARRIVPLFPSYVFVRIEDHWWSIANTIGVIDLLMSGEHPAKLKDEIVNTIKAKEKNGVVKLPEPKRLKPGDRIRIKQGSFEGHFAVFEGMNGHDRSRVLLDLLGRKVVVVINKSDVQQLA
jgi:transcription elongation factor/antiterminator RfaH